MSATELKVVLKKKLKENKMNATHLEKQADLSSGSVRKMLLGSTTNPTLETLIAIADVFGCSIDELIGKRMINTATQDNITIPDTLQWNNGLMKQIFMETCHYIDKKEITPNLKNTIDFILETYNFCLFKKNGTFDKDFYDWYIQQKILN